MTNKKYLVSCGCSWVAGDGCSVESLRLSSLIAKHFGLININLAESGASQDFILRKITHWLSINQDKSKETFLLIGLTGPPRYEYWYDRQKDYAKGHPLDEIVDDKLHKKFHEFHKLWVGLDVPQMWKTYQIIIQLKALAKYYGSEILIFDSLQEFLGGISSYNEKLTKYNIEPHNPFSEIDTTLLFDKHFYPISWCKTIGGYYQDNQNNPDVLQYYNHEENDGHPNIKGNKLMSEVLIKHIEENYD